MLSAEGTVQTARLQLRVCGRSESSGPCCGLIHPGAGLLPMNWRSGTGAASALCHSCASCVSRQCVPWCIVLHTVVQGILWRMRAVVRCLRCGAVHAVLWCIPCCSECQVSLCSVVRCVPWCRVYCGVFRAATPYSLALNVALVL